MEDSMQVTWGKLVYNIEQGKQVNLLLIWLLKLMFYAHTIPYWCGKERVMKAQDFIECNYQELLNKHSFQGGVGLINAALNLVSRLFQFFLQGYAMIHAMLH